MFLKIVCQTYMLALKKAACINKVYEGEPHMLKHDMLANNLLDVATQAAFNAAFFMVKL